MILRSLEGPVGFSCLLSFPVKPNVIPAMRRHQVPTDIYVLYIRYKSNNCLIDSISFHPFCVMLCIYKSTEMQSIHFFPHLFHLKAGDLSAECLHMLHGSHIESCRQEARQEVFSVVPSYMLLPSLELFGFHMWDRNHTPIKTRSPLLWFPFAFNWNDCVLITFRNSD